MNNKIIVPKSKRGEDGYKVTSVRMPQELAEKLDKFTSQTDLSRNEVIVTLLTQALEIAEIEDK